ncbi:MAG TPA: dephospho-CoA kinase, partial [Leeuwenhoekiella sp.]|nr:dephospho-CoA kinase [Leeuwenhoekiella sp.]
DRINKQWPDAKKIPLADFLIENIDLEESKKQAREIHLQLLGDRVNT